MNFCRNANARKSFLHTARSASPMTRKMIEETERKLLNRSIFKNYSKWWKHQRIKESKENFLQENLSLADYAKVLALTRKRNFKKLNYKNQHLSKKFEKMLKKVTKNHNTLSPTEKEEHQRKTLLNFANVDIPKEFVPLLSKGLDFKVAAKKLPIVDMICDIEEAVKKFTSNANEFRFDCKRMTRNGQRNRNLNVEQQISAGLGEWLKQKELVLIENDKGRATCIIETKQIQELIEKELSNQERYKELEGDNIEKVKKAVNKELKSLCDKNKITTDMKEQLKQITPTTPIARPTLKAHKKPLKVRLIINTKGSSYYKIAKFVSRELKPLTTSATSFIKDSEQFVNKLKNIQLQEEEKIVSFDIADMHLPLPKQEVIKEVERRILSDSFQTKCNKETLVRLAKLHSSSCRPESKIIILNKVMVYLSDRLHHPALPNYSSAC